MTLIIFIKIGRKISMDMLLYNPCHGKQKPLKLRNDHFGEIVQKRAHHKGDIRLGLDQVSIGSVEKNHEKHRALQRRSYPRVQPLRGWKMRGVWPPVPRFALHRRLLTSSPLRGFRTPTENSEEPENSHALTLGVAAHGEHGEH
jgi:hypothetical protein